MSWPKGKPRNAENVPYGTTPIVKEETKVDVVKEAKKTPRSDQEIIDQAIPPRKLSDETDRKGPHHPLCHGCGHRDDMHHSWQSEQVLQDFRDHTGKISQRLVTIKHVVMDGPRPCQHACKCTEYK